MNKDNKSIKVLQILNSLGIGGAENWLRYVIRYIDIKKYKIDILVHDNKNDFIDEFAQYGANIIYCPLENNPWIYARKIMQCLRQHGPYDIIHSHLSSAGLHLFLAHHVGIPVRIAHCHTNDLLELKYSNSIRHIKLKAMQFLTKRYATAGYAVSEQAMNRYGPNWSSDPRWRVFYCGIDLSPFYEKIISKDIRDELGIPEDAFVVGHVGRFDHLKNHSFILEITKKLLEIKPNSRLLLVGNGPLFNEAYKKAEKLGIRDNIIFTGLRKDVPRLMKGAMDVFILPSLSEGLPLVLMETQAAGLPAVVTDAITHEVDIIKPLISRVSLGDYPDQWCKALISGYQYKKIIDYKIILNTMEKSKFNIKKSSEILMSLYSHYLTIKN
jgi:glycosyltransferase involved in cell wall biosynthesis